MKRRRHRIESVAKSENDRTNAGIFQFKFEFGNYQI
jgi:hypothetical protein